MRERERQTATKPRYYIRGIEITAQTGLGRFGAGGGLARDFEHHHHVVHLGLGRARWQGTQGHYPTTSTASLPVLARRFRADLPRSRANRGPSELVDQGQHIEVSAALELGANSYEVLVPRSPWARAFTHLGHGHGETKNYIYIQTDRDKTPILYKSD